MYDILPESLQGDPQVRAACEAIDAELAEIYRDIPQVAFWPDLANQTSPLLDVLMWEYHVDWTQDIMYGTPLTDQQKREAIDKSILWHQKKGTKWAVQEILRTAFPTANVVEWYQYGGRPYYFRVVVNEDVAGNPALYERMVRAIMATKNVRSWLDPEGAFIRPRPISWGYVYAGGLTLRRVKRRINSYELR